MMDETDYYVMRARKERYKGVEALLESAKERMMMYGLHLVETQCRYSAESSKIIIENTMGVTRSIDDELKIEYFTNLNTGAVDTDIALMFVDPAIRDAWLMKRMS
jgi:hypothetical protein